MAIQPGWLTASEIAEKYGIPDSTLRHWAKREWIGSDKRGRTTFYLEADVIREKATIHPRNRRGRPRKKEEGKE